MKYYIDFECWIIEAVDQDEACKKAESMRAEGIEPKICEVSKAWEDAAEIHPNV